MSIASCSRFSFKLEDSFSGQWTPEYFKGLWTGTYTCTVSGGGHLGGKQEREINQLFTLSVLHSYMFMFMFVCLFMQIYLDKRIRVRTNHYQCFHFQPNMRMPFCIPGNQNFRHTRHQDCPVKRHFIFIFIAVPIAIPKPDASNTNDSSSKKFFFPYRLSPLYIHPLTHIHTM